MGACQGGEDNEKRACRSAHKVPTQVGSGGPRTSGALRTAAASTAEAAARTWTACPTGDTGRRTRGGGWAPHRRHPAPARQDGGQLAPGTAARLLHTAPWWLGTWEAGAQAGSCMRGKHVGSWQTGKQPACTASCIQLPCASGPATQRHAVLASRGSTACAGPKRVTSPNRRWFMRLSAPLQPTARGRMP